MVIKRAHLLSKWLRLSIAFNCVLGASAIITFLFGFSELAWGLGAWSIAMFGLSIALADTIHTGREERMGPVARRRILAEVFSDTSIQRSLFLGMALIVVGGLNIAWILLWSYAWVFGALMMCAGWTLLSLSVLKGLLNAINVFSE